MPRLGLCWGGLLVDALSGGCHTRSPAVEVSSSPLTASDAESGAVRMAFSLPASATGQQAFYESTHSSGFTTHGSILPHNASHFDARVEGLPAHKGYTLEVNALLVQGCPCAGSAVFDITAQTQSTAVIRLDAQENSALASPHFSATDCSDTSCAMPDPASCSGSKQHERRKKNHARCSPRGRFVRADR